MNISKLHSDARAALAGEPDPAILMDLVKQAQQLSDMVGWADGIIDRDGRVSEAFIQLQAQARKQHETTGDENVAIFHDALGDLLAAIFRHDEDVMPSAKDADDSVDIDI